ncbi:ribonuclease HII [Alicyclobacillus sp. SP_1]|uniref:ribonuclease HII n=1 Tax=Alicyclobacillus sp. SP_1 TaxID=2942475 RepID=UPI00215890B1|nr:ribonuclease HII [Alicyclobacillus sp. SP_1]
MGRRDLSSRSMFEDWLTGGMSTIAGVDEVGRGCLAGPVVAAAVVLPREFAALGSLDSKKLTSQARERTAAAIREVAVTVAVGQATVEEIDQHNIQRASLLAMYRAVAQLDSKVDIILVDGVTNLRSLVEDTPSLAVIRGDERCPSIAAASIVAKVWRDHYMRTLNLKFPDYAFDQHMGYGTKRHLDCLQRFGPTEHHRYSFAPVQRLAGLRKG